MRKHRVFSSFIENQKNSYELIMTAVLIAIGVNLLSTGIVNLLAFSHRDIVLIIVGVAISIGVVVKIFNTKLKGLNKTISIKGFIIYNEKDKQLVKIPEYGISEDMVRYLESAFSENKALEMLWKRDLIGESKVVGGKPGENAIGITSYSGAIFIELLEYCVIEKLSTHLADYFNNYYEKPKIREYGKTDIPEILLQNRFLKLFSEDMNNRAAFAGADAPWNQDPEKAGTIIVAYSSGALYKRFDLVLPENSKIIRKNKNEIVIETPILRITISCLFGGFGTILKAGFHKYYLCINNARNKYHDYQFNVEVSVKFKFRSLFSKEKELYYAWIDSFLDTLANYVGQKEFFEKINWDTAYTLIRCSRNIGKLSADNESIAGEHTNSST